MLALLAHSGFSFFVGVLGRTGFVERQDCFAFRWVVCGGRLIFEDFFWGVIFFVLLGFSRGF